MSEPEATIETKPGRYFALIVFIASKHHATRDFLACVYRHEEDGVWWINYRFRYYATEPGAKDRKSGYTSRCAQWNKPEHEEHVVALFEKTIDPIVAHFAREDGADDVEVVRLRPKSDDPKVVMGMMLKQSFTHPRTTARGGGA